ncbi:MAG TPA: 50S ribosomal protein L4 [Candidatus Omnitrophica bacterium]|nr:50S ribosomal protein L4 [Candidatus Omnitrophota bacterium]
MAHFANESVVEKIKMQKSKGQSKDKKDISETLVVYDMQGKKIEELPSIFNGPLKSAAISQAVTMYLANQRCGLASTKTIGEVSGGGKKPWKQKGTGRARAGSIRSPLWRHGGVVFGPHPKDFHYTLSAKLKNAALRSALNEKNSTGDILVLEKLEITKPKTKEIKTILDNLKIKEKTLLVLPRADHNLKLAIKNMVHVESALAQGLNALDCLKAKKIIFTKEALGLLNKRLENN